MSLEDDNPYRAPESPIGQIHSLLVGGRVPCQAFYTDGGKIQYEGMHVHTEKITVGEMAHIFFPLNGESRMISMRVHRIDSQGNGIYDIYDRGGGRIRIELPEKLSADTGRMRGLILKLLGSIMGGRHN